MTTKLLTFVKSLHALEVNIYMTHAVNNMFTHIAVTKLLEVMKQRDIIALSYDVDN